MQSQNLIQRDLAAGFPIVENLQHPRAVAPKRPRLVAIIGREGSAGKADNDCWLLWRSCTRSTSASDIAGLRAISAELAARGVLNERGRPFNPKSVAVMLAGRAQCSAGPCASHDAALARPALEGGSCEQADIR
jgi:hypothetical protein